MTLNTRGKSVDGKSANPGTLNTWLKSHGGYSGNSFIWTSVSPLGMKFSTHTTNHSDIKNCLWDAGCDVILNVNSGGHYQKLPYHFSNNKIYYITKEYSYTNFILLETINKV